MTDPTATARLLLRAPVADDLELLYRLYSDPAVWTHLPSGRHRDQDQTDTMLQRWIRCWRHDLLGPWIVEDLQTREFLGHGGCEVRRGTFWNLGYRLTPAAQGRGLATEVALAAMAAAHRTRPELPVVAYLLEHNRASAAVARKVGLALVDRGPDAGNPDPEAVRLVYSDRALDPEQARATRQ